MKSCTIQNWLQIGPGSSHADFLALGNFLLPIIHSYSRLICRLTHSLYQLDSDGLVLRVVGQRGLAELTANT